MKPNTVVVPISNTTSAVAGVYVNFGNLAAYANGYILGTRLSGTTPVGVATGVVNQMSVMLGTGAAPTVHVSQEYLEWLALYPGAGLGFRGAYHDHRNPFPGGIPITPTVNTVWVANLAAGSSQQIPVLVHFDIWTP